MQSRLKADAVGAAAHVRPLQTQSALPPADGTPACAAVGRFHVATHFCRHAFDLRLQPGTCNRSSMLALYAQEGKHRMARCSLCTARRLRDVWQLESNFCRTLNRVLLKLGTSHDAAGGWFWAERHAYVARLRVARLQLRRDACPAAGGLRVHARYRLETWCAQSQLMFAAVRAR